MGRILRVIMGDNSLTSPSYGRISDFFEKNASKMAKTVEIKDGRKSESDRVRA